ncbi:hypothetical protein Poly24_30590 [Rosistilla carotiformis]|uniref:Uncharacterized protein n=1 Tax=Rosistilla carotiformis TaxID=2528017 RepID=A0A518JUX0_9BACT|nr:hypothetical protein [Rosistilla carotiformis]QDV69344.1 hypothetical protein Poly24_30590 [Rosistilla carotiformis]
MKVASKPAAATAVAARVAGEDIQPGDFVTVLTELVELPSFLWACSSLTLPAEEPIAFRFRPQETGKPLKVFTVCLPFVYAKNDRGAVVTIDTRLKQLVRLDRQCARKVWKQLRSKTRRKRS